MSKNLHQFYSPGNVKHHWSSWRCPTLYFRSRKISTDPLWLTIIAWQHAVSAVGKCNKWLTSDHTLPTLRQSIGSLEIESSLVVQSTEASLSNMITKHIFHPRNMYLNQLKEVKHCDMQCSYEKQGIERMQGISRKHTSRACMRNS